MKTIRLNRIAHLAELSAARQWSTLPLRGETLRQALRAVETPAAGVGAVLKPLRLNPGKSLRDISAQRQRLSQALSRAVVRNTGADAARHRQLLKRGAVIRAVDDYVIPHANPLLGSKFREMAARRRVVEFGPQSGQDDSRGRKIARRVGIGAMVAGAATLPAAMPMLKIAARNKMPGGNAAHKFIPDYIEGAQRALNGPLTGRVAGAVIQRKRAATKEGTLPRFMADHYARFRAGHREALGHWQYEVGESIANKVKARGKDVATDPSMQRFLAGSKAAQDKINEGLWKHGLNEREAIRRALADPAKPISDYGRMMMTHKAAAATKYAKIAAASPGMLVGGGALYAAGRKRKADEKRELAAAYARPVRLFAKTNPDGTPKRMVQLKGPAPAKKAKEEGWLARNKWKLAGGAAMIAGLGAYASLKDRGMKLPYNPHQSVGQEVIGIKPQAAKDWEAAERRAAKEAKNAGRKAETDVIKAATPPTTAAETRTKQPRTIKPENVQRATDNLWRKVVEKKISPKKALAVYARFHGADATKGYDIEAKFRGKNGAELRGRARSQRANWVKKEIGPIAPGATSRKGQGTFAFAAAASRRVVEFALKPEERAVKERHTSTGALLGSAAGAGLGLLAARSTGKRFAKQANSTLPLGKNIKVNGLSPAAKTYIATTGALVGGGIGAIGGALTRRKEPLSDKSAKTHVAINRYAPLGLLAASLYAKEKAGAPYLGVRFTRRPHPMKQAYPSGKSALPGPVHAQAVIPGMAFFNDADPDQYNQFTPSLYGGTIYRKGRRALVAVKRSGGMAQDIADTAAGKPREPGRKKEWEKSWFKNAVAGMAIGAGIWGTPRLYARAVTNKTHGTIRPGTTWADTIDSVRRGEHRKLFAAVRSRRVVEFLAKDEQRGEKRGSKLNTAIGAAGLLVGGTALAHGIHSAKAMQRNTNAALKAATEAGQSARRVSDEVIPLVKSMHSVVADNAKDIRSGIAASARVANRVDKVTGLPGAMVRAVKQRFARKQLAAVCDRIVNLEDWRLADMRGNSARVFSPKAKRRDRREKTEWEKAATQRKVRNAAIGAAVGLGGLSAYLGFKNMKLRRAASGTVPKVPPAPAAYSQEFFRNAAGA